MDETLRPVLVSGGGRSGTTLLMQLLGSSARVAFDRVPPFEHRYLTFVLRSAMLGRPQEPPEGWNQAVMTSLRAPMMGPIPWRNAQIARAGDQALWRDLFLASWAVISNRAILHGETEFGTTPTHYAEKTPPWVAGRLDGLIETDELIPIRDPRDVFVSVLRFTERRGRGGFGVRDGEAESEFASRFAKGQQRRLRAAIEAERSDEKLVVRYENLIRDLAKEAGRVGDHVGLVLDSASVLADRSRFADHMTSATPEDSVGRWRTELDAEVIAEFDTLSEELDALGYPS